MQESCTPTTHGYQNPRSEMVFKKSMMKACYHLKSVSIMDLTTWNSVDNSLRKLSKSSLEVDQFL